MKLTFKFVGSREYVVVENGLIAIDQITRIESKRSPDATAVRFFLADGSWHDRVPVED